MYQREWLYQGTGKPDGYVQGIGMYTHAQPPLGMGQGIPTPNTDTYYQPPHVWLASKQYTSYWNAFLFFLCLPRKFRLPLMLKKVNVSMWLGYYASCEEVSSVILEVNSGNPLGTDDKYASEGILPVFRQTSLEVRNREYVAPNKD